MASSEMKRFYTEVSVVFAERSDGYCIALDGRNIRTPLGEPMVIATKALAEAIGEEWNAQEKDIKPNTMPMMQMASTWLDRVVPKREDFIEGLIRYAETDLICYQAEEPVDLIKLQKENWQPLLNWAKDELGANLVVTTGIVPVPQSPETVKAVRDAIETLNDGELTGLSVATDACGSIIVALALVRGHLNSNQAYQTSQLDELYQASLWGEDYEAIDRRKRLENDIKSVERFLSLIRA